MKKRILSLFTAFVMLVCGLTPAYMAAEADLSAVCTNYDVTFEICGADTEYAAAIPDGDNGILDIIVSGVEGAVTVAPTFSDNKAAVAKTNPEIITVDLTDGFAVTEFEVIFEDSDIPAGKWTINAAWADFDEEEKEKLTIRTVPEEPDAVYAMGTQAEAITAEAVYTGATDEIITYQWYSNTLKSTEGGTAITGATSASYTPSTDTPGTVYYYAVAVCKGLTAVSEPAEITVEAPALSVDGNVIDISDRVLQSEADECVRLTDIKIIGVKVEKATENDTEVNIVLDSGCPDDAQVAFEFGAEAVSCGISGHTGEIKLSGKKATQAVTITAKSAGESPWEESVTYTLVFSVAEPSTCRAERLEITKLPTKTSYTEGESFEPDGMEVTVHYSDGSSRRAEAFEYSPEGRLSAEDTEITVTYKEDGAASVSTAVAITVEKKQSGGDLGGSGGSHTEKVPVYDSIEVYITLVNRGEIVVQNEKIKVYDRDRDGKYCVGDAFLALHKEYYPGKESGYKEISGSGLDGWVSKFWGRSEATFTYAHNYRWAKSTKDAVFEGDTIAVVIGTDEMFYSDLYTWFDEDRYSAGAGESITLWANGLNLMASNASYDALFAPVGADVTVYSQRGDIIEDMSTTVSKDGTFTLVFKESGTYTVKVSGKAQWGSYDDAPVAPSVCTVKVSGIVDNDNGDSGIGGKTPESSEKAEEKATDLPKATASDSKSAVLAFGSDWPQFLGNPKAQGISAGDGAVKGSDLKLRWEKNTGSTWCDVPGSPIVIGEYVYYYSSGYLRKLELATGNEVASVQLYGKPVNQFFVNIAFGEGKIFVPCQTDNLDDGIDMKGAFLRVFDAETLKQLYVTESLGSGQMQSPVMYHDGYFVTGIYGRNAVYAGFTAEDEDTTRPDEIKKISWRVDAVSEYGFSFNGAAFVRDMCYFGNGNILSIVNYKTGESRAFDIGEEYSIRSTITYSNETNRLYVAANHRNSRAALFSYELESDGMPKSDNVCKWESGVEGGGTQSAPVIYNGRLYLGGGGHTMGSNEPFHVLDAVTLKEIYSVPILSKGSASISAAYANEENNNRVYIYMVPYAPNEKGASELWIISDSEGQTEAKYEITENTGRNQYCSQSLVVASDGSLIWYNDGGYLYCYENLAGIFEDTKSHWARNSIAYMARRKIVNGVGSNMFAPEGTITRAQLAQILANMSGEDFRPLKTDAFSDVGSQWFAPAVAWAVKTGIADTDSGKYLPDDPVSREDMALMLYRYATKVEGVQLPVINEATAFIDAEDIGMKNSEAVAVMQQAGIINGIEEQNGICFAPKNQATRAQASVMISRFCMAID